ncbi:GntR family transcriptional regulator [Bifidobacterium vansinderenii]|uniref:GntR family transcriptional regulator n=1 Tax=Bifidobacterium vansinderenii TaxID=1984871 RepID=A0A229VY13_9BIFI|nr:GntR family transcriptional regulator [Bifidobacterium vansinderenii]OXN00492.1 GntR family transcriptional regulator [Bifidobacterium vansinderenii]
MIIEIDQSDDVPIYEQLRRQVIEAIANGELVPGDKLPSVRSLAVDLGVNLHTVNKAYALLRDDGYLNMRRGSGAVVAERRDEAGHGSAAVDGAQWSAMNNELRRIILEHKARGGTAESFLDTVRHQCASIYGLQNPSRDEGRRSGNDVSSRRSS